MLTLLGSIIGFLGSMVPEFLKFFQVKGDQAHELQVMDRQMQMMKLRHFHMLEELQVQENVAEINALYNFPKPIGIFWVDVLSGTVRPVLTYGYFFLYFGIKIVELIGLWHTLHLGSWTIIVDKIWHEEDQALFAAVMSFWFGQRALRRLRSPGMMRQK